MSCSSCGGGYSTGYYSHKKRKHHRRDYKKSHHHEKKEHTPVQYRNFSANLTGAAEVPPVRTTAYGQATVHLAEDGSHLRYRVTVHNTRSMITSAHFHVGRAGSNGPVARTLNPFGRRMNSFVSQGTWSASDSSEPLTPQMVQQLHNGGLYINVHTVDVPAGEVRGQLLSV